MNRIHSAFGTFRTHWKKSTFGLAVAAYAGNYAKKKWDDNLMMKQYCHEALSYGEVNISSLVSTSTYFRLIFYSAISKVYHKVNVSTFSHQVLNFRGETDLIQYSHFTAVGAIS